MKRFSLRSLAAILAIAILVATCSTTVVALDIADGSEASNVGKNTITVTDAQIVADYGFIGGKEGSILSCRAIVGRTHTISLPTDDLGLVAIDAENKTIKAETFKSGDYVWTPVEAYVVYTDYSDTVNPDKSELIVLDEPSMGLSPLLVSEVFKIIETFRNAGQTVLLVEQNAK